MSRIFKVVGCDVKSARSVDQLGAPHAQLSVILEDDVLSIERALARAYDLGRRDMRADLRQILNEP